MKILKRLFGISCIFITAPFALIIATLILMFNGLEKSNDFLGNHFGRLVDFME